MTELTELGDQELKELLKDCIKEFQNRFGGEWHYSSESDLLSKDLAK